ncbi:hypothetical protein [Pseudomonas sp. PLB05]|uniref:hypothetical protein n=1 Tax=Pseudomonas sp. PLB05 TaxID=2899078 RepID=UPI001E3590B8|nr:hypothetical protein [Pseudomonas sp. PLB05]MCD4866947.1 hypothetical protein [Pseudomonas sp. PLB05]
MIVEHGEDLVQARREELTTAARTSLWFIPFTLGTMTAALYEMNDAEGLMRSLMTLCVEVCFWAAPGFAMFAMFFRLLLAHMQEPRTPLTKITRANPDFVDPTLDQSSKPFS